MTARYNGYYYSNLNIDDGIFKIEKNNKDNFDKILPVYVYPTPEKAKSTFPEFDKAIKKSSFCIQRHTIKDKKGNEAPEAGKWIDNNWINIGISSFYKREFFTGLENFEYVARTYTKSKDKYTAMLWMAKTNNEVGAVSSSEQIISLLKNEKKLPKAVKKELPVLEADYYTRRGLNTEAASKLMEAMRNSNLFTGIKRDKRARYAFIIAQLFEKQKENKRALKYYKKCIQLKPNYDLVFYSKIKMARLLDVKRNNSEKTKKDLLKMSKEFKNSDYYDVIFYTLGEVEEKENNQNQALFYYKKAVQTSIANPKQKALAYLKIGEINFEQTNYVPAGAYYDSAIVTLPKDYSDYETIVARKKTLNDLVTQITIIKSEDSLQRIAKMGDAERNTYIDKIIAKIEKEEERKLKEKEDLANNNGGIGSVNSNSTNPVTDINQKPSFYFYNPTTIAFGVADFQKKWGSRNYEDNWRRNNKAATIENPFEKDSIKTIIVKENSTVKNPSQTRDFYKKNLPIGDSLISKSNRKIIEAYYAKGSIYKEELNNTKKAVAAFEELNTRFPNNKYLLNNYYVLYRINLAEKRDDKANFYKDKLINEFPDSEFALLLKDPSYAEKRNSKKSEVESFYAKAYRAFHKEKYDTALTRSIEGIKRFGLNDFTSKFEFIKALSLGKLKGVDSMEYFLKLLVAKFPKSEITPLANDILVSIKKQKNPDLYKPTEPGKTQLDTFLVNMEAEHFLIALVPNDPKIANSFKNNLDIFCTKYYSSKQFNLTSTIFGVNETNQLVLLKTFTNANEIMNFYTNVVKDPDIFKGDVKKEMIDIYPILASNLPFLYKKKNTEGYKLFFADNFKIFNIKQ